MQSTHTPAWPAGSSCSDAVGDGVGSLIYIYMVFIEYNQQRTHLLWPAGSSSSDSVGDGVGVPDLYLHCYLYNQMRAPALACRVFMQ